MRKRTKKKCIPLAEKDGVYYLDFKYTGIGLMLAAHDGLAMTYFGDDPKRPYMRLDDVLEWHRKELHQSRGRSGSEKVVSAILEIQNKIRNGKVRHA